jgi:predicted RNA binding protein YcfA (HicA-like mRNA interferase family)
MKIPRDLDASDLLQLLRKNYGYEFVRQSGSHIRLRTIQNGEHFITVPNHSPLKVGTLNQILSEVADHFNKEKNNLMQDLFG